MTTGRLAVLSNVNMNMVIRMLQKNAQVYEAETQSSITATKAPTAKILQYNL